MIIDRIAGSPVVQRYMNDDYQVADWAGLLADRMLSSGESDMAQAAFRIGRETGLIDYQPELAGVDLGSIDLLQILGQVDAANQQVLIEALAVMCGVRAAA